jgi:hypothetical protein
MQGRFVYTLDFERKIELALSRERLDTYREILPAGATFVDLIQVYNANTAISEASMGPIQVVEITTRNSIHKHIANKYGDDWYQGNKLGLDPDGDRAIKRLIRHYSGSPRYNTPRTLAIKIVSELTLGFWTNLFRRQYEDPLWRKCLRFAFPHVGGALTRGDVYQVLDKIRRLRNRIGHHEQILHYDLNTHYNSIIDLLSWVIPVTAIWLSHHNRFYEVMEQNTQALSLVVRNPPQPKA